MLLCVWAGAGPGWAGLGWAAWFGEDGRVRWAGPSAGDGQGAAHGNSGGAAPGASERWNWSWSCPGGGWCWRSCCCRWAEGRDARAGRLDLAGLTQVKVAQGEVSLALARDGGAWVRVGAAGQALVR